MPIQRKDCRYYYTKLDKYRGFDKPTADFQRNPYCRINRMTAGGCNEDCKWFEPKL